MTTAEKIARQLGCDGLQWETEDGVHFVSLVRSYGCKIEAEERGHRVRYVFADGSALVEAGGAWDVEGEGLEPYSWQG